LLSKYFQKIGLNDNSNSGNIQNYEAFLILK